MKKAESEDFYGSVVVGQRGQIVIPIEARNSFQIKPGDKLVVFGKHHGGLMLIKADAMREFAKKILEKI